MEQAPHHRIEKGLVGIGVIAITLALADWLSRPIWGLEDGRIGVLYVGCFQRSAPYMLMRSDPLFSIQYVEASLRGSHLTATGEYTGQSPENVVRRIVRLYMPRSYRDLTSRFDVVILANANRDAVGPSNIELLARGVGDGGMGLLMVGGAETFGGTNYPPWGDTAVGSLLPTEDVVGAWVEDGRLVIDRPDNEFVHSLPWGDPSARGFMDSFHHNLIAARSGAETLGSVRPNLLSFDAHPGMVTWRLPTGARVFAYAGDMMYARDWDYFVDLGSNLIIYIRGLPVPQDHALVHDVRTAMQQVGFRKSMLTGLMDFCESFGANTQEIYDRIGQVDGTILDARAHYVEFRYQDALDSCRKADEAISELERDAVALKNEALAWVYLVEWLAVVGTFLSSGYVLWTIMVRRGLYTEVRATRVDDGTSR